MVNRFHRMTTLCAPINSRGKMCGNMVNTVVYWNFSSKWNKLQLNFDSRRRHRSRRSPSLFMNVKPVVISLCPNPTILMSICKRVSIENHTCTTVKTRGGRLRGGGGQSINMGLQKKIRSKGTAVWNMWHVDVFTIHFQFNFTVHNSYNFFLLLFMYELLVGGSDFR